MGFMGYPVGNPLGNPVAIDFVSRFGVLVQLERRDANAGADADWEGTSLYAAPVTIRACYDPASSDLGRDDRERRTGTVLTYEDVSLGDRINGQEVTQVIPHKLPSGTFYYNEVSL